MPNPALQVRFLLGAAGGVAAGLAVFRFAVFNPTLPAFQCVTVGLLTAALIALVRDGSHREATMLVLAFTIVRFALTFEAGWSRSWRAGVAGLLLGFGIYLSAIVFHLLAENGLRFGKFLLVGPMLGGLYLAQTPLVDLHLMTSSNAVRAILFNVFLGVVIGDGVGFGAESAEFVLARERASKDRKPRESGV